MRGEEEDLLDRADVAEAAVSSAHLLTEGIIKLEDWDEKRLANKKAASSTKPPTKPPTKSPTRVQRLDRALGRGAKVATRGIAKGLSPVEKVLAVAEIGNLAVSEDARQKAIDSVGQMGRDPNVTPIERAAQGFADPFATAYGLQHYGRELLKTKNRAKLSEQQFERGKRMLDRGETPATGGIIPDPKTRERMLRRREALRRARKLNK